MSLASSAITITSHSRAIDAPSPTAEPFRPHTIGTSTSSWSQISCLPSRRSACVASVVRSFGNHAMSPPAENALPVAVSTMARAVDSCFSVRNNSPNSRWRRASTAFNAESG